MSFLIGPAIAIIGAQLTHALALTKYFSGVRASSFLTIIFIAISSCFTSPHIPTLQALFFGASFIGMTDPKKLSKLQIAIASILYIFAFYFFGNYFSGTGGLLGFSAFLSCLFVHLIWEVIKRFGPHRFLAGRS